MARETVTIDGNEAAAYSAFKTNEVIAIYPITPSSPMGELADYWGANGQTNIWGSVPDVVEMQSEGGAAGAVHGALQTGSLTTTFTASQGLLLMIPNLFKIAGELTSTVFHIAARSVATHALSIFGDHSDVMAARSTGWGMLFSNSVQEVMDLGLIAQAATLEARVPFLHAFDGFRTSHEVSKVRDAVGRRHPGDDRRRPGACAPSARHDAGQSGIPRHGAEPGCVLPGTRGVELRTIWRRRISSRRRWTSSPSSSGAQYHLFDYVGAPDAERVVILMGSGREAAHETVKYLTAQGEKVGMVKVRLYRPFSRKHLLEALPATVKKIAVLDRTKEPGATGEPLYIDVVTALAEARALRANPTSRAPRVVGGRYGLSSKEFTPAMIKAVFDELVKDNPKNSFTVGIIDDVTHTSLDYDPDFDIEPDDVVRAVFWGLGADGTVGANKNSIKIIGEETDNYAQGHFVYDSKKSGALTVSHLRFGPNPIQSTYLIRKANFVAVHQFGFFQQYDVLEPAMEGATLLINAPYPADEVWDQSAACRAAANHRQEAEGLHD